ncbi:MAG: alkaline phosphatase family protein [Planctomycetota bacterium]|jgi:predicted AlkP superfamily phosphohydrolase/phosphomutase
MKVFLLGLDGMTLRVIEPYIRAGLMPNLEKIIDSGSYGVLRSTIPSLTGPAWMSIATGKNPGKHGIYEFRRRTGYKTQLITKCDSAYAEPVWSIASRNGKRVIVVNVPFTYPPDRVNGIMISGLMTPGRDTSFVFPKEFKKDVLKLIPDYTFEIDQDLYLLSQDKNALLNEVLKITADGRKLMNYLLENHQWDFFFMVFVGPDRLQHFLWNEVIAAEPKCAECFRMLDDTLGDVMQKIDDRTVLFIVSDHGFMPANKGFYINNFFREMGLLQVHRNSRIRKYLPRLSISTIHVRWALRKLGLLDMRKHLPDSLLSRLRKLLPPTKLKNIDFDFHKTKVFSPLVYGIVCVNLKGREPHGIIEGQEYDELCKIVKDKLLGIKDPETGGNIVEAVWRGRDLYTPEHSSDMPDLIVVMREGYSIIDSLGDEILGPNRVGNRYRTGDHDQNGMWAAHGSAIANIKTDADIYDIMPTILYLMGMAIPHNVDGRVLKEIVHSTFTNENTIRFEQTESSTHAQAAVLSEDETERIRNRLKSLGYFE